MIGVPYSPVQFVVVGGQPPYTWSANGLPPGMSFSPSGYLSGTPTSGGFYAPQFTVTDSLKATSTLGFSLSIDSNLPPTITTSALPEGEAGFPYRTVLSAVGSGSGNIGPFTWAALGLPAGLTLNPDTGVIIGIITAAGVYNFQVTVKDAAGLTSPPHSFALTIAPQLSVSGPGSLSPGTIGVPYGPVSLIAADGVAPYTWSATGLPSGLSISSSGSLSGTPSLGSQGVYHPDFLVFDALGNPASSALALAINPPGSAPLSIVTTLPLAAGSVGHPYSQGLVATGGNPPYVWKVAAGLLPPGIALSVSGGALSAILSGVPTGAGTFPFTMQVSDAADVILTRQFKITISPTPISSPTITPNGIVNAASNSSVGIAPGEIVTISGSGLGPDTIVSLQLDQGLVSTSVGGTQVLFDDVAAPILYTEAGQVSVVVPYAVGGKASVQAQVSYQGEKSNSITVPVFDSMPGIFTRNASGAGPGVIMNQNGTVNSPDNPASEGLYVWVYATGDGQTNPSGIDGKIGTLPLPITIAPISATIGGLDAKVQLAGGVSGLVAGVMQVKVLVPLGVRPGDAVPIVLTIGDRVSQPNVTVAIK